MSQTMTWMYDKNGNRLTEARSAIGTTTYGYKNDGSGHSNGVINTITPPGSGAIAVTHSSAGDLTLDEQAVQYSYDALGRVTEGFSVSGCTPSARNVLGRDSLGHRVVRSVYPCNSSTVSKTEYFVYGADGSLYFREGYNGAGSRIEREAYSFLEDEPVAILRSFDTPTGNFFLHNDHLGRPLAMSGTDGFLKWKGEFEPFGKSLSPRVKTSGIEPGFRFPGQWEYGDSGDVQGGAAGVLGRVTAMEDNWNRSYAQRWGRYTQSDPIGYSSAFPTTGYPSSASLYAYVSNRPSFTTDPAGLSWAVYPPGYRRGPNDASIVCDGNGNIVVDNKILNRCLRDCADLHEQSHKADVERVQPTICYQRVAKAQVVGDPWTLGPSERKGIAIEITCLTTQLLADPGGKNCCQTSIEQQISGLQQRLTKY